LEKSQKIKIKKIVDFDLEGDIILAGNKMKDKRLKSICFMTIFISFACFFIFAQDARFRGSVKDEYGNPIVEAKITLTLVAHNLSFTFKTDKKGKFYRRGIEPGEYLLTVEVPGYQPVRQNISFSIGQEYKMDIIVAKEEKIQEARNKFEQGILYFEQGKFEEAIEAFEAVLKEKPDFAEGYYNLGMVFLRKGENENAEKAMAKAIEIKPDFIEAYFGLGQVYVERGEEEEALKLYQKAIEIKPNEAKIFVNLGALYFSRGEEDLALEALLKAKELDPSLPNTYYQLGLLYYKKQDLTKSVENFEKFLEFAPSAPEANSVREIIEELKKKIKNSYD